MKTDFKLGSPDLTLRPIVFFDGVCNLCNFFVDYLIRRDKKHRLFFASLQGETAKKLLPPEALHSVNSVYFLKNGRLFKQSSAVIEVFALLGFPWNLILIFKMLPSPISDAIYKFVAQNRYRWFGQKDSCRLPTETEKDYFLP